MSVSALSYEHLTVSPYDVTSIQTLEITQAVNEHARLRFSGVIPDQQKERYVAEAEIGTSLSINAIVDQKEQPLFQGIVLHIEVKAVRDVYYLDIEAVSASYILDIQRKQRSFQNKAMTIPQLLEAVGSDYAGADLVDEATGGAAIGKFIMQYQETDWQFLKRIASRFQAGLLPFPSFEQPKVSLGLPDGDDRGQVEAFNFSVSKRLADYRYALDNVRYQVMESDYIDYEVETYKLLNLGSKVTFQGKALYVRAAYTELRDSVLYHRYTLCPRSGMKPRPLYNDQLIGASIQGKVLEVSSDQVRVHLDIDQSPPDGAWWFTYSTVYTAGGSSGWYCMPEVGDRVIVHFPSREEDEAVAISSVREDNSGGNPAVKHFRSPTGQEVRLSPGEVTISAKDGDVFIRLNDKHGIEIISSQAVNLITKGDMTMSAGKSMTLSAKKALELTCKESRIQMDGSTVISGRETKTN